MKKRKILYLFPLAALVLYGCTLQEGWDVVKDFSVTKVYEPVRDFFLNLFGKEVPKKEEEEQKPSGEGEGEGGGQHEEGETSKYGTQAKPLTVSEAAALIDSEDPTLETMYVTGEIVTNGAWNDQYQQIDFTISDGQVNLKVFRAVVFPDDFKASEVTANSMKGMSLVASGIGMTYKDTYEVASDAENGIMCTVLSFAGEPEEQGQVDNYGTAEHPLTVSEAIEVIKVQDPTNQPIYVTGEVSGNGDWYASKSNIDIYLTDGENTIQMFRADKFPEGMDLSAVKKNELVGKIVVGKGIGTYYVDGKKYELDQHCEVISMVDPVIEIEGVELSATELSLEVGQQASLTAKVLPEDKASQEVTWTVTSNDTPAEVISCNNGTIVAQAVGTAVVTATSVADPSKTAECTVTVTEATKELQSIAFAGEVTKTEYNEDESYSIDGLKVMAHYNVGDDEDITENATITLSKETAELGDTSFTVTASYGNLQPIEKVINVTVAEVNQFAEAYAAALAISSGETAEFTFKGVIVAKRQNNEWFIQHDGMGIEYYANNDNFAVGKLVKVTSTLQNYKGLPETKTIKSSEVLGDGTMPTPVELASGADVAAAKLNVLANVTGTAKADWSDYTASSNKTLTLVGSDGQDIAVYFKSGLFSDKEAALKAVKEGDTVSFSNVVTSMFNNPQILFAAGSDLTVTPAPVKEIASITSITGPNEVALNGTVSINDVTVVVEYTDGSSGNAKVTAVTVDTTSAGEKTADVTIEGWNETLHFNITVSSTAPETINDVLDRAFTGVTGTSYTDWSNKKASSNAVYAGQSAGGNESIQLRSKNSNSGIVTTTSGGKLKKVIIVWNSNTTDGNKADIYCSNTAFTSPTELYGTSVGTKVGSITKGTSTELEITDDYTFVGVRSNSGAIYITSITFVWGN